MKAIFEKVPGPERVSFFGKTDPVTSVTGKTTKDTVTVSSMHPMGVYAFKESSFTMNRGGPILEMRDKV